MRTTNIKADHLREGIQKIAKMLARNSVKVTQIGAQAYCQFNIKTGKVESINLPMIPDRPTEAFLNALQGYLDHEVAHALFTDAKGGLAVNVKADLGVSKHMLHSVTNAVEDVRIEREMAKLYAGSGANLAGTCQWVVDEMWGPMIDKLGRLDVTDEAQTQQARTIAFVPYLRARGGQYVCRQFLADRGLETLFAEVDRRIPDMAERLNGLTSTADAAALAADIIRILEPPKPPEEEEPEEKAPKPPKSKSKPEKNTEDKAEKEAKSDKAAKEKKPPADEDEEGEGAGGDDEDDEEEGDEEDGEGGAGSDEDEEDGDEEEDGEEGEGSGGDPGDEDGDSDGDEDGDSDSDDGEGDGDGDSAGTPGDESSDDDEMNGDDGKGAPGAGAPMGLHYGDMKDMDEALATLIGEELKGAFDSRTQTDLTREFDVIEPYPARADIDCREIESTVAKMAGSLQKELQRIITARRQSVTVPGFRSGRLNCSALHRLAAGDDRVFKRKHVAETNEVAVSLVVDLSGSMTNGRRIETAIVAAWAFSEVLDRLKIPNEVTGFTSGRFPSRDLPKNYTRDLEDMVRITGLPRNSIRLKPIWIPVFKGFNDKFNAETKRRLTTAAVDKLRMSGNDDATAILYAGERLRRRPETRKIMIVFSDGQPAESGIDQHVLWNSLRQNVIDLEKQGMETIGVGIESNAVSKFYPKHFMVRDASDLPKLVMTTLRKLLIR